MQNAWLVAAETREKELRTINEELRARQKESAGLQESLGHLEALFKDETERLAARREELTAKEASLLEAQRYLATILGGNDTGPSEGESRPSSTPTEPPAPPEPSPVPVPIESPSPPEPVEPERRPDTESRPAVTKADAMERLTRAIEAWKRARDGGRNVSELRNPLKLAKEAIQAGQWENAIRLATEVLEALQSPVIAT
jgi:predicted  nucleic acid-binding Zn-ribbon protein